MNKYKNYIIIAAVILAFGAVILAKNMKRPAVVQTVPEKQLVSEPAPASLPSMLEFGAIGCIPCKAMEGVLEELRKSYRNTLIVRFINVREEREETEKHKIQIIPTQIFLAPDGKEIFRHEGYFSADEISAKFKELGYSLKKDI